MAGVEGGNDGAERAGMTDKIAGMTDKIDDSAIIVHFSDISTRPNH